VEGQPAIGLQKPSGECSQKRQGGATQGQKDPSELPLGGLFEREEREAREHRKRAEDGQADPQPAHSDELSSELPSLTDRPEPGVRRTGR